jgi:hypothetical protein
VEREALLRALRIESSNCSKLKVLTISYSHAASSNVGEISEALGSVVWSFYLLENLFAGQHVNS